LVALSRRPITASVLLISSVLTLDALTFAFQLAPRLSACIRIRGKHHYDPNNYSECRLFNIYRFPHLFTSCTVLRLRRDRCNVRASVEAKVFLVNQAVFGGK
jgi:hypothetical protein